MAGGLDTRSRIGGFVLSTIIALTSPAAASGCVALADTGGPGVTEPAAAGR